VLTRDEYELYRQVVYMLASRRAISAVSFPLAIARAEFARSPAVNLSTHYEEQVRRKRKAYATYADLVQLNFAYVPPFERKVLVPTLQATSLRRLLPHRPLEPSTVDRDFAEKLVEFSIELRRVIVESFLRFRPRRATDIYAHVSVSAEKLLKDTGFTVEAETLRDYIIDELFTVPYYLHHYKIMGIHNIVLYDATWYISP
jgi:hypothetical protein